MKQSSERLGVKIVGGLKEVNTPWAGSSLLVDLFRKLEMDKIANKVLPALFHYWRTTMAPAYDGRGEGYSLGPDRNHGQA